MIDIEYKKSCTEVLEILKYIASEEYNKIPNDIISVLEKDKDNGYHFEYDVNKTLEEQNVSKQARIMIALFFRDYWATEHQREVILANERSQRNKIEEERRQKYNSNDIFKNSNQDSEIEQIPENDVAMIEYKESIFKKIVNWIRSIF